MTKIDAQVRVAVIDDDFHDVTYAKLASTARETLNDETSDDYVALLTYLVENQVIPSHFNPDEPDSVEEYFGSPEFELWLRTSSDIEHGLQFIELAVLSHREGRNYRVFKNIEAAFTAPDFELTFYLERPSEEVLKDYDLIFMDVQVKGDDLDTADKVADYLNNVKKQCDTSAMPIMILMSIETRIEQYRDSVRQRAKMSALSFHIMNKSRMDGSHAVENLKLLWLSTLEHKPTALLVTKLHEALSDSFSQGWERTEQLLWNLDAAALLTLYHTIVTEEKMPFDEGIMEMINKHHLHCVEQAVARNGQFNDVIEHFKSRGNSLFPSLASESLDASHNLQATLYASGSGDSSQVKIENYQQDMEAHDVMRMLPFGAFISKDSGISIGTSGIINITQLCDLSKHIVKKDNRYLRFLEARIVTEAEAISEKDDFVRVWAIKLNKGESERMYMRIDSKISSYSSEEILSNIAGTHQTLMRLRPEFVRQLREDLFQKMSSYESQPAYQPIIGLGRPYLVYKGMSTGKVYEPILVDGKHLQYRAIQKQSPKSMAFYENDMIDFSVSLSIQMSGLLNGVEVKAKDILDCLREGVPSICGKDQTLWAYRCYDKKLGSIQTHNALPTLYFDMCEDRIDSDWASERNIRLGADEDKKP